MHRNKIEHRHMILELLTPVGMSSVMMLSIDQKFMLRSTLSRLMPGLALKEWKPISAARAGNMEMLGAFLARGAECASHDADLEALEGDLGAIQCLRAHGIHCTSRGADWAAESGHLEVIRDLRANGIHCTSRGATTAVQNGKVDVAQDLHAHGISVNESDLERDFRDNLQFIRACRVFNIHGAPYVAENAAWNGHLDVIRDLRAHGIHCSSEGANNAAARGHLDVVQDLRNHDIHCTSNGADRAAEGGHLPVIEDLHAHGIDCTSQGADFAASKGDVSVVRFLRACGINCTLNGASEATRNGRLEMVRDLCANRIYCTRKDADSAAAHKHFEVVKVLIAQSIYCTSKGADWLARHDQLTVLHMLQAQGILCTSVGADDLALNGHLEAIQELRAHNVHCTSKGANGAAKRGHAELVQDLQAHGICCTADGANWAATNGHFTVVHHLRAHGIHCTSKGADGAAMNSLSDMMQDLRAHDIHCTSEAADWAAQHNKTDMVQDLRAHGIHCTPTARVAALLSQHRATAEDARRHAHLAIKPEYLVQPSSHAPTRELARLSVAMDVDGTLLSYVEHYGGRFRNRDCVQQQIQSVGLEYGIFLDTGDCDVLRPYAREFLQELATFADIVLYTNRVKSLADHARRLLDPSNTIIKDVFCRDHAQTIANVKVAKDLYFVAPSLSRAVLVDDEWTRFGRLQLTNCLPAKHWLLRCSEYHKESNAAEAARDDHLMQVTLPMLRKLAAVPDVRPVLAAHIASQNDGLSYARFAWQPRDVNAASMALTAQARVGMLQKFGAGLNPDAIQDIADTTTEYAMYALNMIEDCAAQTKSDSSKPSPQV